MAHTCRGTLVLTDARIQTEAGNNFTIFTGSRKTGQSFHLRAHSEKERQEWITVLELAKRQKTVVRKMSVSGTSRGQAASTPSTPRSQSRRVDVAGSPMRDQSSSDEEYALPQSPTDATPASSRVVGSCQSMAMTMLVCFPNVLPCGGRRAGQGSGEVVALLTQHVRRQPLLPLGPRISPARPLQVPVGGGGPSADIHEGPAEPHGTPAAGATACCCGGAGSRGLPAEGLCRDRDRALGGGSAAVAGCSPPLPPLPSALPTCHV